MGFEKMRNYTYILRHTLEVVESKQVANFFGLRQNGLETYNRLYIEGCVRWFI